MKSYIAAFLLGIVLCFSAFGQRQVVTPMNQSLNVNGHTITNVASLYVSNVIAGSLYGNAAGLTNISQGSLNFVAATNGALIASSQLSGILSNAINTAGNVVSSGTVTGGTITATGQFNGNAAGLTNVPAGQVAGTFSNMVVTGGVTDTNFTTGSYTTIHGGWFIATNNVTGSFEFVTNGGIYLSNGITGQTIMLSNGVITASSFAGNASGLSNAVSLIAGSNVTITTNADNHTFTLAVTNSSGSGISTNYGSGVSNTFTATTLSGTTTFSNSSGSTSSPFIVIANTNDGNGLYVEEITSSNSPSTWNTVMSATQYTSTNAPDNAHIEGWNIAPGGSSQNAGEATLYVGMEREWFSQFENYLGFRSPNGVVTFRPWFYGISRTNGICQKIEKLDTWEVSMGLSHNVDVMTMNSNTFEMFTPTNIFGPGADVWFDDHAGVSRSAVTNGVIVAYGVFLNTDGQGNQGIWFSPDKSITNRSNSQTLLTLTSGQLQTIGSTQTNLYSVYGTVVSATNGGQWQIQTPTDQGGLQIYSSSSASSPQLNFAPGGVNQRFTITCEAPTGTTPIGAYGNYAVLYRSKGAHYFAMQDSSTALVVMSNSTTAVLNVTGNAYVTGNYLAAGSGNFTNGIASYTTNALMTVASTGATNSTGINQLAWITAATGMQLYDCKGNAVWSGTQTITTLTPIPVQNNGYFTGTAITSVGTHAE